MDSWRSPPQGASAGPHLPRGRDREIVLDGRDREYTLRGSQTRTLSIVGAWLRSVIHGHLRQFVAKNFSGIYGCELAEESEDLSA